MAYLEFPYAGEDPDDLLEQALARIASQFPNWTPRETHLEYAVLSEMAQLAADTRLLAADVADELFVTVGEKLFGLPRQAAVPATGTVVFTFVDTTVRTVPAGTQLLWPDPDAPVLFSTVADTSNAAGSPLTAPVSVVAEEPGASANGLIATTLDLIDSLAFVQSVAATSSSAGGQDAEATAVYLDRLAELLTVVRPAPVLLSDFAVAAKQTPGVFRALALDAGERAVRVIPLDAAGRTPAAPVVAAMQTRLDAEREVNFQVLTGTPTYTAVRVVCSVSLTGQVDSATVLQNVRAAVLAYLSPATWGGGDARPPRWDQTARVRYLELGSLIDAVPGVQHVESLLVNGAQTDLQLAGIAPLPTPADDPVDPTTITVEAVA